MVQIIIIALRYNQQRQLRPPTIVLRKMIIKSLLVIGISKKINYKTLKFYLSLLINKDTKLSQLLILISNIHLILPQLVGINHHLLIIINMLRTLPQLILTISTLL